MESVRNGPQIAHDILARRYSRVQPSERIMIRITRNFRTTIRSVVGQVLCAAMLTGGLTIAHAALPAATFDTDNATVTVDGHAVPTTRNTITYADGEFHMWFVGDLGSLKLDSVTHATSEDGIHFISQSTLAPDPDWWKASWYGYTAQAEPVVNFLRIERIGNDWILMIWHPNEGNSRRPYIYNTSLWRIGPDPSSPDIELIGPLPSSYSSPKGPGGRQNGVAGLVNGYIYLIQQHTSSSFGRYQVDLDNSAGPLTDPNGEDDRGDLYTGAGQCAKYLPDCSDSTAYIQNKARVLDQGGTLRIFYSLRDISTSGPVAQQLWYAESDDNGETWGEPEAVFAPGSSFSVDGNTLPPFDIDDLVYGDYGFSGPEVVALPGNSYRGYFDTEDTEGNFITVTSATPTPPPGPATVAPIPALDLLGLAALAGLLGGAGAWRMRRQQN